MEAPLLFPFLSLCAQHPRMTYFIWFLLDWLKLDATKTPKVDCYDDERYIDCWYANQIPPLSSLSHPLSPSYLPPPELTCTYQQCYSMADALSCLPESTTNMIATLIAKTPNTQIWTWFNLEDTLLEQIRTGYETDPFTTKLWSMCSRMSNIVLKNGFWFISNWLFVPNIQHIWESLFHFAHDAMGHFGAHKSYTSLRDSYYWPHMRCDLELGYIPSWADCQQNKARMTPPFRPLHLLPVPDGRCDSIAMDFISPLLMDNSFDCILTITDRLSLDIRLIPTTCSLTAEKLATTFFKEWYCKNSLPSEIILDCDKLFVSHFWKALHKLTGIALKLSSSYHPQLGGSSEWTNKTVIQCIQYMIECDQKGWSSYLPKVQFDILNTVNKSMGFTPFQLQFGKSLRLIPPLGTPNKRDNPVKIVETDAHEIMNRMRPCELEAMDNLLTAKINQCHYVNKGWHTEFPFKLNDHVVLSTRHCWHEYKVSHTHHAAKFMPRFDRPYRIIAINLDHSTVTLKLPNSPHTFPVFHTSEIQPFRKNDNNLFPTRALHPPNPIMIDRENEFFINKIVNEWKCGCRRQYKVRWVGKGPKGNKWLPASKLEDCKALDKWATHNNAFPSMSHTADISSNATPTLVGHS